MSVRSGNASSVSFSCSSVSSTSISSAIFSGRVSLILEDALLHRAGPKTSFTPSVCATTTARDCTSLSGSFAWELTSKMERTATLSRGRSRSAQNLQARSTKTQWKCLYLYKQTIFRCGLSPSPIALIWFSFIRKGHLCWQTYMW